MYIGLSQNKLTVFVCVHNGGTDHPVQQRWLTDVSLISLAQQQQQQQLCGTEEDLSLDAHRMIVKN